MRRYWWKISQTTKRASQKTLISRWERWRRCTVWKSQKIRGGFRSSRNANRGKGSEDHSHHWRNHHIPSKHLSRGHCTCWRCNRGETTSQDCHIGEGVDIGIFLGDGRKIREYNSYAQSVGEGDKDGRGLVRKSKNKIRLPEGCSCKEWGMIIV